MYTFAAYWNTRTLIISVTEGPVHAAETTTVRADDKPERVHECQCGTRRGASSVGQGRSDFRRKARPNRCWIPRCSSIRCRYAQQGLSTRLYGREDSVGGFRCPHGQIAFHKAMEPRNRSFYPSGIQPEGSILSRKYTQNCQSCLYLLIALANLMR